MSVPSAPHQGPGPDFTRLTPPLSAPRLAEDAPPQLTLPAGAPPSGTVSERPHPMSPLVKGWIAFVAVGVVLLQEIPGQEFGALSQAWWVLLAVVGMVFVVPLVLGYFSWRYTRFIIDDEQVRIERTFISHRSERIAFTKIQSVDVVQPMVARLFGLAALRIDVDSGASATSIEYLTRDRAYQLRDYLITRAHGTRTTVAGSARLPVGTVLEDRSVADRVIVRVPAGRLLGSLLISTGTVVGILATAAVVVPLTITDNLAGLASTMVVVPWLVGLGSMVLARMRNEFNFTLTASADGGLRTASGLTSLMSQTIPRDRVQAIDISQPLLWRPFRWFRIRLDVLGLASGGDDANRAPSNVLLPVGTPADVDAVLGALWPQLDLASVPMRPIPARARWLRWLDAHTYAWGHDDHVLVASGRLLNRRTSIVPHARVQSVRLRQGPLQRALRLASVEAHTTSGPVDVVCRHLDEWDARLLATSELDRMRSARRRPALHHSVGDDGSPPASSARRGLIDVQ